MIGEQQRKGSGPRNADCGRVIRLVLPPVCRREISQKMKTHRKQIGNENGNGMDGGISTYLQSGDQSGDSIRKWRDSYSKTCLRSLFQRRRGMKTHIYRKKISACLLSGHKSGHRTCQRAISYSERRVTPSIHKTTPTDLFVKSICLFRQLFDDRNTCFVLKSARPVKYNDKYTNKCSHLNRFTKRAQKRAQEAHPW